MHHDLTIVLLFSIATGVALAVRVLDVPYTVALVLVGVGVGATKLADPNLLRRDLLFSLFLPGLIFEASYHLKLVELRQNTLLIVALAVPGVVVGMGVTAALLAGTRSMLGSDALRLGPAMAFAAVVAATDPIAVVALFRKLDVPRALGVIVEGESLLNDATAIVLFSITVAFVSGATSSWMGAALEFVRVLALGALVGAVLGASTSAISRRIDDAMIETTLTVIAAYGSFALADRVGASGVIATVTAGMICGSYGQAAMSTGTRHAVAVFWEYAAFALNSLVFLSMGFAVHVGTLLSSWRAIGVAYFATLFARAALVAFVTWALRRRPSATPWRWSVLVAWGGLRGALSMVLALSLPEGFPGRQTIVTMTYGVVLLSLVVQGLSLSRVLRWLGVGRGTVAAKERV